MVTPSPPPVTGDQFSEKASQVSHKHVFSLPTHTVLPNVLFNIQIKISWNFGIHMRELKPKDS